MDSEGKIDVLNNENRLLRFCFYNYKLIILELNLVKISNFKGIY